MQSWMEEASCHLAAKRLLVRDFITVCVNLNSSGSLTVTIVM